MRTAIRSQLMTGPIEDGIYKSRIGASGSNVALRPLLCRGPIDGNGEATYLERATEVGGELVPSGALASAKVRREQVRGAASEWRQPL